MTQNSNLTCWFGAYYLPFQEWITRLNVLLSYACCLHQKDNKLVLYAWLEPCCYRFSWSLLEKTSNQFYVLLGSLSTNRFYKTATLVYYVVVYNRCGCQKKPYGTVLRAGLEPYCYLFNIRRYELITIEKRFKNRLICCFGALLLSNSKVSR